MRNYNFLVLFLILGIGFLFSEFALARDFASTVNSWTTQSKTWFWALAPLAGVIACAVTLFSKHLGFEMIKTVVVAMVGLVLLGTITLFLQGS